MNRLYLFIRKASILALAIQISLAPLAFANVADKAYLQKRNDIMDETINNLELDFAADDFAVEVHDKQMGALVRSKTEEADVNAWSLSLSECTELILEQNSDIKISYLDLDTTKRNIKKEQAAFLPTTSGSFNFQRTRTPAASGVEVSSVSETVNSNIGIDLPLVTGGTISTDIDLDRTGRKHSFTSDFNISVTQPILEGFGVVNLSNLKIARNNYDIAIEDLKSVIISEIANAQTAYWEILNANEVLKARQLALQQALDLLKQTKREMELGKRTVTDVLQAEATAASRDEQVLQAENTLRNQEDNLKEQLNVVNTSLWHKRVIITERVNPEFDPIDVNLADYLRTAFKERPDYQQILQRKKNDEISLSDARNGLLPDLDFNASYNMNGAGPSARNSVDSMFSHRYADWQVGASVSLPWFEQSDRETYNQEKNDLKRRGYEIKNLQLQIVREVRAAVRAIKTNIKRVKAANLAHELQEKKLEAAIKKYSHGVTSSFEVLEFQEDLVNASVSQIRAIVDYQQSLISLWQTLGTTLEKNGINLE